MTVSTVTSPSPHTEVVEPTMERRRPELSTRQAFAYSLTGSDALIGPFFGVSFLALCLGLLVASLGVIPWTSLSLAVSLPLALATLLVQTMLYTGLFITAHDAMHGTACWKSPRLNALLGQLALTTYALFSLKKMKVAHGLHHDFPAESHKDPDFHDGEHKGFFAWYGTFLWRYVSIWQIVGMAIIFNVLAHACGIAEWKLLLFWVLPSLVSTLQLFFFGTYLPHRDEPVADYPDGHRARSNDWPAALSMLACFHFGGFHHEHHGAPSAPWWRLPEVRRVQEITTPLSTSAKD